MQRAIPIYFAFNDKIVTGVPKVSRGRARLWAEGIKDVFIFYIQREDLNGWQACAKSISRAGETLGWDEGRLFCFKKPWSRDERKIIMKNTLMQEKNSDVLES